MKNESMKNWNRFIFMKLMKLAHLLRTNASIQTVKTSVHGTVIVP